MEILQQYHHTATVLLVRVFLGLLFLFQGYDAVFNVKIKNIIPAFREGLQSKRIPGWLTIAGVWFTSFTELICGALLICGLFEYAALYLLGINLLVASIAFAMDTPLWNMRHVFPRLVLLVFLLATPAPWHNWALDHLLFNL